MINKTYTQEHVCEIIFPDVYKKSKKSALRLLCKARFERKISFRKFGNSVTFTENDINDYLKRIKQCQKNTQSESFGSLKGKTETSITSHIIAKTPDKQSIKLLAQQTFGKPKP